jgi:tetratricopeptide (TPR) repeat protein
MLLHALGRAKDAFAAERRALAAHDGGPGEAVLAFCRWHRRAARYDRALYWAARLFELDHEEDDLARVEEEWVTNHRLSGRMQEILPWIRERCADGVPEHLAWDIYSAVDSFDHELAEEAARVQAEACDDEADALEWRIHEAGQRAQLGDRSLIDDVVKQAGDDAEVWAQLSWMYGGLERYGDADDAAMRAFELDGESNSAITAMLEAHVRHGDIDAAVRCAERLLALHPYAHQGPERLGELHAKLLRVDDALRFSERAVDAAPFCHVSQDSRALALFVAGRYEEARRHAERSLGLCPPDEPDEGNDALMIVRAIRGDLDGVRRCLAGLAEAEPESVFAEYKRLLLKVASRSEMEHAAHP